MIRSGIFTGLMALVFSICGLLNPTTPPTQSRMPATEDVVWIEIWDNWIGLSPLAPIVAEFNVTNSGTSFSGAAHFEVGDYGDNPQTADETIEIPVEVIQAFLDKLNEATLEEGQYVPHIDHTDDYPDLRIEIYSTTHDEIIFESTSQGGEHIPWGATFEGVHYTINSGIPMEALEILKPYLKYDVLENLKNSARDR